MRNRIKYIKVIAGAASILLFSSLAVMADELHQEDGIMNNHSAEYVRSLNRNTSTDPDAAFYNPAGLAFLPKEGIFLSVSNQTLYVSKTNKQDYYAFKLKDGSVEVPAHKQASFKGNMPDSYVAECTAPVLPSIDVVWKKDTWAAYFDFAITQAAKDMTYRNGLGSLDWGSLLSKETSLDPDTQQLELYSRNGTAIRNEMYAAATFGGAYQFFNWLSAGGGLRLIAAQGDMKIKMTNINIVTLEALPAPEHTKLETMPDWNIETQTSGFGFGLILSSHFRPEYLLPVLKGLEGTLRAEYYAPMVLQKKTKVLSVDGTNEAGGSLDIFKDGTPGKSFNYKNGNGSKGLKVTYPPTLNLGLSYLLFGKVKLLASSQLVFRQLVDLGGKEKNYNFLGYSVSCGAEYDLTPKITVSGGYLYNDPGIKPDKRTESDSLLIYHQFGTGVCLHIEDNLDVNLGALYQYCLPATVYSVEYVNVSDPTWSYLRRDYSEKRISVAMGVTYRFFTESPAETKEKKETDARRKK